VAQLARPLSVLDGTWEQLLSTGVRIAQLTVGAEDDEDLAHLGGQYSLRHDGQKVMAL
jgi:hypothetical protein